MSGWLSWGDWLKNGLIGLFSIESCFETKPSIYFLCFFGEGYFQFLAQIRDIDIGKQMEIEFNWTIIKKGLIANPCLTCQEVCL